MRKRRLAVAFMAALLTSVATVTATADHRRGFKTAEPAQLVAVEPGVRIDPILSTGDIIGDPATGYQMSGIPDGLGAYESRRRGHDDDDDRWHGRRGHRDDDDKIHILMNHELDGPQTPPNVGSRISKVTVDERSLRVLAAEYLFTGLEGFTRFCSSTLEWINGKPMYFTGEEDTMTGSLTPEEGDGMGRGGSSIAMDARTGEWRETVHFGKMIHENIVPVKRLSKAFFLTTDDDFREPPAFNAYVYAYIAPSWKGAIRGTQGSLYVWKADGAADSSNDIAKGQTLQGRFVPVTRAEATTSDATLEAASVNRGAFKFARLEDAAVDRDRKGRLYFADTGKLRSETVRGRIYRMDVNPRDPTRASITLLLDGDTGDNLVNPDNLDTSERSLVIQEDRNSEHRVAAPPWDGYSRVLVYDLRSGNVRYVARVNTPPPLTPGTWESSGVINAFDLLGKGWWFMDVQAHGTPRQQPGPDLRPRATPNGEHGQLMAVYIPRS